jgi:teichuronic acid exporter
MIQKLTNGHWPIFLLSSLSSVGNLFLPIILVRLLSPDDVGIYKIFFLHLSALPFLVMAGGPIHSVFYWVGKPVAERIKSLNATWILTLLLSSIIIIFGFPFKYEISAHLHLPLQYIALMLFSGFLWCPSCHFSETSIANGRQARGSLFDTIFEVTKTLGFVYIAWKYKSLSDIFLFFAILLTIKLLTSSFLNYRENNVSFESDQMHIKKVMTYCLPISFSGCLSFFVDKIDLLLLSGILDSASFAFYSMGCLVIPPLYLLEMSVQKVLIPSLSKNYVNKEWEQGAAHFRKGVSDISFLIIPSIFGLCTFAKPIIEILYTDKYLDSIIYLQIFSLSYLLLIIPHDSVARASGHTKWILKMYLLITPLSLGMAYLGAKFWGAKGVLILTILMKFIPKIMGLRFSKKTMNWQWQDIFPLKHITMYFFLSGTLSLLSLMLKPIFNNDISWFLTCGSGFALFYLSSIYMQLKKKKYETH